MRKLLILVAAALSGCSSIDIDKDSWDLFGNVIPRSLEKLPFVYRPLIVQGNLITPDKVNQLKPGMSSKQVELTMGTALLQDIFHDRRWDYYYGIGIGTIELEKYLTLYFDEQNRLTRIEGDYRPLPPPKGEGAPEKAESVIKVPDWQPPPRTLFEELMHTTGLSEALAASGLAPTEEQVRIRNNDQARKQATSNSDDPKEGGDE